MTRDLLLEAAVTETRSGCHSQKSQELLCDARLSPSSQCYKLVGLGRVEQGFEKE